MLFDANAVRAVALAALTVSVHAVNCTTFEDETELTRNFYIHGYHFIQKGICGSLMIEIPTYEHCTFQAGCCMNVGGGQFVMNYTTSDLCAVESVEDAWATITFGENSPIECEEITP